MKRFIHLHPHFKFIELITLPVDENLVVACQTLMGEQNLFDLGGKDIDASHDKHIVCPPPYALHPDGRSATGAGVVEQGHTITRAVAQEWQGFARQAREDQFAGFAIWETLAALRVYHLRVEVILINMQSLVLRTLGGHTRANHLGQPIDIERLEAKALLDLAAHAFGPGLCPEEAHAYFHTAARVTPLSGGGLSNDQGIGGGPANGRDPEIFH